jgi:hypothetical protein
MLSALLLLCAATPSVAAVMLGLTVSALEFAHFIVRLQAFSMTMTTPAQETSWGFLAVDTDVVKVLAAVTLCLTSVDPGS